VNLVRKFPEHQHKTSMASGGTTAL